MWKITLLVHVMTRRSNAIVYYAFGDIQIFSSDSISVHIAPLHFFMGYCWF